MKPIQIAVATVAALLIVTSVADARPRHRHHKHHHHHRIHLDPNGNQVGRIVGGRKAGWPARFCGAEASNYIFGTAKRELWLAYNWIRKFQRTEPAPGMAAARSGHVMVLMHHVGGSNWMVHDGNSGGRLTREHVRSIAGFVIVDPNRPRMASN